MDPQLQSRIEMVEKKMDLIYISVEKTRKYFLTILIVSVVAFVLPLIGLLFAIPSFLSSYSALLQM